MAPGGHLDTKYWSRVDGSGNHLNPYYTNTEQWADPNSSLNGYEWFEANALIAWENLGDFPDDAVVYRLETGTDNNPDYDKTSGIMVSAVNDKGKLHILVSYMKTTPGGLNALLDLNTYFEHAKDYRNSASPTVDLSIPSSYAHIYTTDFFTPDINGDHLFNTFDIAEYNALYLLSDARLDWNQDGFVNGVDASLFVMAYSNAQDP